MTGLVEQITAFVAGHSTLAYGAIFLIAAVEAFPVLGAILPGSVAIIGLAALIPSGTDHSDDPGQILTHLSQQSAVAEISVLICSAVARIKSSLAVSERDTARGLSRKETHSGIQHADAC